MDVKMVGMMDEIMVATMVATMDQTTVVMMVAMMVVLKGDQKVGTMAV